MRLTELRRIHAPPLKILSSKSAGASKSLRIEISEPGLCRQSRRTREIDHWSKEVTDYYSDTDRDLLAAILNDKESCADYPCYFLPVGYSMMETTWEGPGGVFHTFTIPI